MNTTVSSIEVAETADRVVFLIKSRGTFQLAPLMKGFFHEKLKAGVKNFEIDMSDCPAMDSTFLGTLAGLSFAIKKSGPGGAITIRQANDRNSESLKSLGIDRLFTMTGHAGDYAGLTFSPLTAPSVTKQETMKQSLEAHETLIKADDSNQEKFKDVVDMLKKDLSKE
nr:STAS domain-containing protein [Oscillatoria laete-virens]